MSFGWTSYHPDDSDDIENEDIVDPFVFVWRKFWTDRENIKTAITCSDKSMQGAYEGVKKSIDRISVQQTIQAIWTNMIKYGDTFK